MRDRALWAGAAACVMVMAAVPATAQAVRAYEIPAGSLRDVLNRFAAASDQQIFFEGALVEGRTSPGLRGRFTRDQALQRLLDGTGLDWREPRPGVLYLRRVGATAAELPATEVDDVVVTGSLLRQAGPPVSPVISLGRDALDRRAEATVSEVLAGLPQNYAGAGTPLVQGAGSDRSGSNSVYATGLNLRGLGPTSTLVLVNGRRLAGSGFRAEFADVSALPSAAVERVDVLLDGASALYGADAVAGVVNIIMRRAFDGQESRVRVSAARGGAEDLVASHLAGRSWSDGAGYLSLEYQKTHPFSSLDRPYTADGDLRPYGGTDHRLLYSGPGNLLAFDPAIGGYVASHAIRPGASGRAETPADFLAGGANRQALNLGADLTPAIERYSAYGRVSQSLGDRLDLSADLRYSRRDYSLTGGGSAGIFSVSAANPWFVSPTGAAAHLVGYSFIRDIGPSRQEGRSESIGGTVAAKYQLPADWSLDAYAALAQERGSLASRNRVNNRFANEALGSLPDDPATAFSAARDGYLNLFGDGRANSAAVLDFISSGYAEAHDRSRAGGLNLMAEGPLWTLPGGEVRLAVGAQWRAEAFETGTRTLLATVAPAVAETPGRPGDRGAGGGSDHHPGPGGAGPGAGAGRVMDGGRGERRGHRGRPDRRAPRRSGTAGAAGRPYRARVGRSRPAHA